MLHKANNINLLARNYGGLAKNYVGLQNFIRSFQFISTGNTNKTARIRAKPRMLRMTFKVYGAVKCKTN